MVECYQKYIVVIACLCLILAHFEHFVLGLGNIKLSNGTLIPDVNRPAWMGNGTLVATTTVHCHKGHCEFGDWIPIKK